MKKNIWESTKKWLNLSSENRLLFIIDEAHMYRGAAGGEVSYLLRRLFERLGIGRDRVQFILTTASMPDSNEEDKKAVQQFAINLTASDEKRKFIYLTGEKESMLDKPQFDIPIQTLLGVKIEKLESGESDKKSELSCFLSKVEGGPEKQLNLDEIYNWLYKHLVNYRQFSSLFELCRGKAVSLEELAEKIFPECSDVSKSLSAVEALLAIAPLAKDSNGKILFPARMHMLFRGIKGVYACANPGCPHAHSRNGLTLGEVYLSDGRLQCKSCGSSVYEIYNERRCGSIFFRGYVIKDDFEKKKRTYLWRYAGMTGNDTVEEIHLFIPPDDFSIDMKSSSKYPIQPCYLDVKSGFIDFSDDSLADKPGVRKLYYCDFKAEGKPDTITFNKCPHCGQSMSKRQLSSFNTRGNLSFFNLIKTQFLTQPPVEEKVNKEALPNEGRKVLIFSDSRQRAAKLARDMSNASDMTAARQIMALAIQRLGKDDYATMDDLYGYFAIIAAERKAYIFHDSDKKNVQKIGKKYLKYLKYGDVRRVSSSISESPKPMQENLLRLYCGGFNTFVDTAISWIEPERCQMEQALEILKENNILVKEKEFIEIFNAWILSTCVDTVALGSHIDDIIREKVRPNYNGYGISEGKIFTEEIKRIMNWNKDEQLIWIDVFKEFLEENNHSSNSKLYVNLRLVVPRLDLSHIWYRCRKCSRLTPYMLKGKCPICGDDNINPLSKEEINALEFWREPIEKAMDEDYQIRVIDTEEHTAQLSHKDQRDELWSRTEKYELRFQDFLGKDEYPVDILSSTTTMEVGIDIGSLVAIGLRNIPPMRENYQQRAGRAGRRGASLSTIVTFCEDGPHDSMYFSNPIPMFRGDPRRPWIDVYSNKIIQRHLNMITIQSYLEEDGQGGIDDCTAEKFLNELYDGFYQYLKNYQVKQDQTILPPQAKKVLIGYKKDLEKSLNHLKRKCENHPELFENSIGYEGKKRKSLLDALYEEGIIPTYSFPKNVVSVYIYKDNKIEYSIERGLDVAIGEYAPGRAIVVDKNTYQIGGLHYPVKGNRVFEPAKDYVEDINYNKEVLMCNDCGWFGLYEDSFTECPFCGNTQLEKTLPMIRPWGFAPRDGSSIEEIQLDEEYTQIQPPLYSTVADSGTLETLSGYKQAAVAVYPNQRVIMLNRGNNEKGFMLCRKCGAMMPGNDNTVLKNVGRPYKSEKMLKRCAHTDTINVNLGYDFITDMFVLTIKLDPSKIDINHAKTSWINKAGQSLAEALRLVTCEELDIEFTELVTGYRVRQGEEGDFIDIYLYDSLSSGAGYAVGIKPNMEKILEKVEEMLLSCHCDAACSDCLKHYRNQFVHSVLNRHAAIELLRWARDKQVAEELSYDQQVDIVRPIEQILRISGINLVFKDKQITVEYDGVEKNLFIYPEMYATKVSDIHTIFVRDFYLKYAKPYAVKEIMNSF